MKEYLDMFLTFFKLGAFTFGGGYAMLPMLEKEIVEKRNWATDEEIMDYYAIGQCTPGIIAVNVATFIGYKKRNVPGAIVCTIGVVAPSVVIISLIATLLTNFADIPVVQHALSGIRVAVCVLMTASLIKLYKGGVKDIGTFVVFGVALALSLFANISTVIMVIAAGLSGVLLSRLKKEAK